MRTERASPFMAWLLAALFVLSGCAQLGALAHNFDEGTYIQQAALVRDGQRPYADFFHHQTPLYLYALALFSFVSPGSLFVHRLPSLLATGASGLVIFQAGRRLSSAGAGLAAQLLFYFASLQQYGLLAMPNALMELLVVVGVVGLVFHDRRWSALSGAIALFASLLVKPLSLPVVLAVGLILLAAPDRARKTMLLVAVGLVIGFAAWGALHYISDGAFTEVLRVQVSRISDKRGFEALSHTSGLRAAAAARGVETAIGWNLSEHRMAFFSNLPWNTGPLLVAAAAFGAVLLAGRAAAGAVPRHLAMTPVLWAAFPFAFSILVWEPVWDHYFVQYLAPLSLLAGVAVTAAWRAGRSQALIRAALVLALASYVALGIVARRVDRAWLRRAETIGAGRRQIFTFDPLLAFIAGGPPACGTIDPLNTYGDYSAAALDPESPLTRFRLSADGVVACLERSPEVAIVVDDYFFWFADDALHRQVAAADPRRVLYFSLSDRLRFAAREMAAP
jgi:hypothetical protein